MKLTCLARAALALALLAWLSGPVSVAANERPSERLFAKYHWQVDSSASDGSASAFILCPRAELRFRVRQQENGSGSGRLRYLELFVNGKFLSRIDRHGLIGLAEGSGISPESGTGWIEVKGRDKVRFGMNKVTLVYRGVMGEGDAVEPGPGKWRGEVELARCRLYDMLRILKGFEQVTGLEAEIYRALQRLDGDLLSADRSETLDNLERALRDVTDRAREVLVDPETRRFLAEIDDLHFHQSATRLDLQAVWEDRLATLIRLESFWVRSRTEEASRKLYRRARVIHDGLEDAALARENLRNLFWVYSARDFAGFTADRFESSLDMVRQNLEVLGDLMIRIQDTRDRLRVRRRDIEAREGRPLGSDDIRGPYEVLAQGSRVKPQEYADTDKLEAAERELDLYLTLVEQFARRDQAFLKLELAFLAEVIGRPPPEPAKNRRVLRPRQKWEK
ncbi:MAG: hypothetical protein HY303_16310 [Candidatus Wallbacteria bacterium]|nr:hypothetical protein [Candidatus Wallbacteria bacterium]